MSSKIIAKTKRLVLRPFCENDANTLAEILADPDVMKFSLSGPYSLEQTQKSLTHIISSYESGGMGLWAVMHKTDDNLIGSCGFYVQEIDGQREIELSYRFAKEYWGKGLATEAAKATCQYAFGRLGLKRLISIIEAENAASIRIAEKCGMVHEKDAVFHNTPVRIYAVHNTKK